MKVGIMEGRADAMPSPLFDLIHLDQSHLHVHVERLHADALVRLSLPQSLYRSDSMYVGRTYR